MRANFNKNLRCIQVKDSAKAAKNHYWHKDKWAIYSEDCSSVGVDEGIDVSNDITISPNPASDYIEINFGRWTPSVRWSPSDLTIYNSLGECIINLTPALSEGEGARIDVSPLAPGLYFVTFNDETGLFIKY
jgi:hypothetical protein